MSSYHKIKLCENQSSHISISVDFIRLETWPMAIRLWKKWIYRPK